MAVRPITIDQIQKNYQADLNWRLRRHPQWTTNYELYRDTVIINRLTQRQSVNVPYMKKTWKTYAAQTNWPVDLEFEDQGNNGKAELYQNAYWGAVSDRNRLDILEEVDRKQEWLYGRSNMVLNIIDGWISMELADSQDILIDRYANPWNVHSGRRITRTGIYRTLSDLERNPMYSKAAIAELKVYFASNAGLIKAGQNLLAAADAAQRMLDMGVPDVLMPALGETYVELNEMQYKSWDEAKQKDVVMVCVTADANQILMDVPIDDILGTGLQDYLASYGMSYTIASWAGDVERTDVWSDGGADSVRALNLVANARWSQKVENGTLTNYGMNFYDSTAKEGWTPIGYDPAPFGFYPLPGPPKEVLASIQIPEMDDIYNEMQFIQGEIEGVSGTPPVASGQADPNDAGDQTAQEIQELAKAAKDRAQNANKYHKRYWQDIGSIFCALVMANSGALAKPTLYKKSPKGKYYPKTLDLKQTYSKQGYKVKVGSKADKEADNLQLIQKLQVANGMFPNNAPLQKISKQKTLDWLNLTPEEAKEVMNFDDQNPAPSAPMQGQPGMPALPQNGAPKPLLPPPGRMPQLAPIAA